MNNYEIADHFSLLSKLLDIHGENSFKSKSYSIAAYHIENLPREAGEMSQAELFSMKGIGEGTGKKILEILNTGRLDALDKQYGCEFLQHAGSSFAGRSPDYSGGGHPAVRFITLHAERAGTAPML